jgi:hypothetical protein
LHALAGVHFSRINVALLVDGQVVHDMELTANEGIISAQLKGDRNAARAPTDGCIGSTQRDRAYFVAMHRQAPSRMLVGGVQGTTQNGVRAYKGIPYA